MALIVWPGCELNTAYFLAVQYCMTVYAEGVCSLVFRVDTLA